MQTAKDLSDQLIFRAKNLQEFIVDAYEAKLLVMGGHRHQGWKDYIFGETIESVRHKVKIPVLIVNS